jgi:ribosomal protein S6--L-glutamate ligase
MRIAILSRGDGWHVQDLIRAAGEAGCRAAALDFRTLHSKSFSGTWDAVLVRTMPAGSLEQIVFRMDLLHGASAAGLNVWNPPRALETCVDKFLTTTRLEQSGLPTPKTFACQTTSEAMFVWEDLGGDVVVKPLFGSEGRGMVRITERELLWRTAQAIEQLQGVIYLQQFVRHPGWDVRAFVLNGRLLASMSRSHPTDWRTNVAQGGCAEQYDLDAAGRELAIRATEVLGARYAGVDLLRTPEGEWTVIEVNAVPGWKALAPTCGIDVARAVIDAVVGERP